jgi:8-oxo-dGTP pyrophosphatase MutT (NUDIX family)
MEVILMSDTNTGFGVKVLILNGNSVLVLNTRGGNCDFPGGRVESGETPEQALLRELREEIGGVKVKILGLIAPWSFSKRSGLLINGTTYVCLYLGGEILLSPEHSGLIWVPLNELRGIDIYRKYGLDKFNFDSMGKSLEKRETYGI